MSMCSIQARKFLKYWTNGTNKKIYKHISLQSQRSYITVVLDTLLYASDELEVCPDYRWNDVSKKVEITTPEYDVLSIPEVVELFKKHGFSISKTQKCKTVEVWRDESVDTFKLERRYKFGIFPYIKSVPTQVIRAVLKHVPVEHAIYKITFTGVPTKVTKKSKTKRSRK